MREAQAFVLNRNSHFDVEEEDTLSGEVGAAIQTVSDLAVFFEKQSWKKGNFKDGQIPPASERMPAELAESRKLARFGPKEEAVKKLAVAHHLAWEAYGYRENVALPMRSSVNAESIWAAALAEKKVDAAFNARLTTARPYLFGSVKEVDFSPEEFEKAAKLLEELCPTSIGSTASPAVPSTP